MATQLFVNIQATSVASALVRSSTDFSPVAFPELILGDNRSYELYLVDGVAGGFASFSGDASYSLFLAIGTCGYPTGGTFTATFGANTTAALAWNISPAALQTALQGLSSIGSGNVTVTGVAGQYYIVTFVGALANSTQPQIIGNFALLSPESSIDVSTIIPGSGSTNCVQLLTFATNPISFANDWAPITNGWTGTLSTRTLEVIEAFAAAGGTLTELFQVTVADPDGNRRTYAKVRCTIQCTIINPESFAGSDKPTLVTSAQLAAAVLGLNNFTRESLTSSAAGNTNVTRATTSRHHVAVIAVSGTAGLHTISILTTSSPVAGDTVLAVITTDSTAGNVVEIHNATSSGTLIATFTTDTTAAPYFAMLTWSGSAWGRDFDDISLLKKSGNLGGIANPGTAKVNLATLFSRIQTKTAAFTVTSADEGILFRVDTTAGSVVATIPAASSVAAGFLLAFQKTDGSANLLTTSPTTVTVSEVGNLIVLVSDGSAWSKILDYNPNSTAPTINSVVQNWFFVVSITGGTGTALDGQATASGAQGDYATVMLSYGSPRAAQTWQLVPSVATSASGIQRPADFDSSTNARVWFQIS